jgi:hypothetical protein
MVSVKRPAVSFHIVYIRLYVSARTQCHLEGGEICDLIGQWRKKNSLPVGFCPKTSPIWYYDWISPQWCVRYCADLIKVRGVSRGWRSSPGRNNLNNLNSLRELGGIYLFKTPDSLLTRDLLPLSLCWYITMWIMIRVVYDIIPYNLIKGIAWGYYN